MFLYISQISDNFTLPINTNTTFHNKPQSYDPNLYRKEDKDQDSILK